MNVEKICFLLSPHVFCEKRPATKMKHVKRTQLAVHDMFNWTFMVSWGSLPGIGIFFVGGFMAMSGCRVGEHTIWRWLFFCCIWLDMPCSYYIEKK